MQIPKGVGSILEMIWVVSERVLYVRIGRIGAKISVPKRASVGERSVTSVSLMGKVELPELL